MTVSTPVIRLKTKQNKKTPEMTQKLKKNKGLAK